MGFSAAPRPSPSSLPGSRRDGQGPHRPLLRDRRAAVCAGRRRARHAPGSSSGCAPPSGETASGYGPTAGATCGSLDSGEALSVRLVTPGIVVASGHPLHGPGQESRYLAGWPLIDFDGPDGVETGADVDRPSLAAILDELREL